MLATTFAVILVVGYDIGHCLPNNQDHNVEFDIPNVVNNQNISTVHIDRKQIQLNALESHYGCNFTVDQDSSDFYQNVLSVWNPNFAEIELRFRPRNLNISINPNVIMPRHWVWTYYSPNGFFPYLKWPVDFPILSFGLLNAKTLPTKSTNWLEIIVTGDCSIELGSINTTMAIGKALLDLTKNYLIKLNKDYGFTYWCFLVEIPEKKKTIQYQFGINFIFPVDIVRYNCCRTERKGEKAKMRMNCKDHQVKKMVQTTIIPYVLGLVAFAYFPLLLFGASGRLMSIARDSKRRFYLQLQNPSGSGENIDDAPEVPEDDSDWVFLDGTSPISFTILVGGLCGLIDRHPLLVSRLRRLLFVIIGPCIIYIQVLVYYLNQYEQTMALLEHGVPMGYLSMIGGYEKSRDNFQPALGGPFLLVAVFYVAGIIFIVLPSRVDDIVHDGCRRQGGYSNISPLFFSTDVMETLSSVSISNQYGYSRLSETCKAGCYMLTNYRFWFKAIGIQFERIWQICRLCRIRSSKIAFCIIAVVFLPLVLLYIGLCVLELLLCILHYGIPMISAMCIVIKGYIITVVRMFRTSNGSGMFLISKISNSFVLKWILSVIVTCLFLYYLFSFCTLFVASFSFMAQVVVFSFISVIVYPASAFGYLFFGLIFLYYIMKMLKGFGEGYFELLADAVEICVHLEHDLSKTRVVDGMIIVEDLNGLDITKLQVQNRIINLSTDQRQEIRNSNAYKQSKVIYRNHMAGIPRDLFNCLVEQYRPVHIQVAQSGLRICLILALIVGTISIVVVQPYGPSEGISEVMHVVFIMAIGALPRILEVALDNVSHIVKKEICGRKMNATIEGYWAERAIKNGSA